MSDIVNAAARLRKYLQQYALCRGIHPNEIHSVNAGTEREAMLTVSDLSTLLGAVDAALGDGVLGVIELERTPVVVDFESTAGKHRVEITKALHQAGAPFCRPSSQHPSSGELMSSVEQIAWLGARSKQFDILYAAVDKIVDDLDGNRMVYLDGHAFVASDTEEALRAAKESAYSAHSDPFPEREPEQSPVAEQSAPAAEAPSFNLEEEMQLLKEWDARGDWKAGTESIQWQAWEARAKLDHKPFNHDNEKAIFRTWLMLSSGVPMPMVADAWLTRAKLQYLAAA